jgi:hypothetical protein
MTFENYAFEHGCDYRDCPARAMVVVEFIVGRLQLCVHHRNASGISKSTWGYTTEWDLDGADHLGAPPYQAARARKIIPVKQR